MLKEILPKHLSGLTTISFFVPSTIIVGIHFLSLLQGLLRLQRDSSVRLSVCLDGEQRSMKIVLSPD